ncbi:hypothetical protein ELG79_22130 [Rhizobium leguminosarum]|uniref:hypothetical protein n=1 Tax=Rhizobium leguminosarum TaxID=384 RepID=UPI00102F8473|nr:hypothetical protein [Rhizobium leguminosarum]TBG27788.1 hypothetical protein ELG79_22130 [Rhizobium leguminosarum]
MRLIRMFVCAGTLCLASSVAAADDVTIGGFLQLGDTTPMRHLIIGVSSGLKGAAIELTVRHQPMLYCMTDGVVLDVDGQIVLFKNYVNLHPEVGKQDLGMIGWVMLQAMIEAFPCSK